MLRPVAVCLRMRILLSSNHRYPACDGISAGLNPRAWPSGSGFFVHDSIAKGLSELGHEVFYHLPNGADAEPPPGVTIVSSPVKDVDVLHTMTFRDWDLVKDFKRAGIPWVATCHLDPTVPGRTLADPIEDNWIFVSRTLAKSLGRSRYVLNGIEPSAYLYSGKKADYFLFMACVDWAYHKGLDRALEACATAGVKLVVAGTSRRREVVEEIARECGRAGADYVGDVRGVAKAQLLAGARALIFPTRINEAFGLVIAEALMSGTPVIASDSGACQELLSPETGILCRETADFAAAIERVGDIDPAICRARALREFHYLRMASEYVREYECERIST